MEAPAAGGSFRAVASRDPAVVLLNLPWAAVGDGL